MKKLFFSLTLSALIFLVFFCSCASQTPTSPANTADASDPVLEEKTVLGLWHADNASFSYLLFETEGAYKAYSEIGTVVRSGGFLIEGEFLVLDGYGIDDDSAWLVLKFNKEMHNFSGSDQSSPFTLIFAGTDAMKPRVDYEKWYGTYLNNTGRISIGKSSKEGEAIIAITPNGSGATLTDKIVFDTEDTASGEHVFLLLEDKVLTVESVSPESEAVAGEYTKQ